MRFKTVLSFLQLYLCSGIQCRAVRGNLEGLGGRFSDVDRQGAYNGALEIGILGYFLQSLVSWI
jgi:hypothetical protein